MKRNKLIILILSCIASFIVGIQLRSIYGFDPPYIYYYAGFALQIISIVAGIIAMVFLMINLNKNKGLEK